MTAITATTATGTHTTVTAAVTCIQATATLATLVGWVGGHPQDHLDLPNLVYPPGLPEWEDRLGPDLVHRLVDRLGLWDFPVRLGFAGSAASFPENFTADQLVDSVAATRRIWRWPPCWIRRWAHRWIWRRASW